MRNTCPISILLIVALFAGACQSNTPQTTTSPDNDTPTASFKEHTAAAQTIFNEVGWD